MSMKQFISLFLLLMSVLSCADDPASKANGQWQLKTIERNGVIELVDTVFYCFQGGAVFAMALLVNPEEAYHSYGYVISPAPDLMEISLDTTRAFTDEGYVYYKNMGDQGRIEPFGWLESKSFTQTYRVERQNHKSMVLINEDDEVYTFKKH